MKAQKNRLSKEIFKPASVIPQRTELGAKQQPVIGISRV
jgi:hypothetical protein